jgi:hypothetical protein
MTEARFSYTRKVEGELLTVRGDTGQEFLENFMWLFGDDEANRFFTFVRNAAGAVTDILTEDQAKSNVVSILGATEIVPPPAKPASFDKPDPSDARNDKGAPSLSAAQQAALAKIKGGE